MASKRVVTVLLFMVAVLPHAPFLSSGCITDDFIHLGNLADNPRFGAAFAGPDGGGFYRPLVHVTYLLEASLWGFECSAGYRITNAVLHGLVTLLAFAFVGRLWESWRAGAIAALFFALAPKAPSIAVYWIAARTDLLMSVFVLSAALAWVRWSRGGPPLLIAVAMVCYTCALLSKEAALLLPAVLVLMPTSRRATQRLLAAGVVFTGALIVMLLQVQADATLAAFEDEAFALNLSPMRWMHNFWNYFTRAVPVSAVMIVAAAIATRSWSVVAHALKHRQTLEAAYFGLCWFGAFIAPALLLTLRSELRVYLPALGLAMPAAYVVHEMANHARKAFVAVCVVAALLMLYQASRSYETSRDARFADNFVEALAANQALQSYTGAIAIVPADVATDRRLRDALGGYAYWIVPRVFRRDSISGTVRGFGESVPAGVLAVRCTEHGDAVVLDARVN